MKILIFFQLRISNVSETVKTRNSSFNFNCDQGSGLMTIVKYRPIAGRICVDTKTGLGG